MTDFTSLVDLADRRLGAGVVAANDEFFAAKENLLERSPPVFDPSAYTSRGKLMDGWETRRRRAAGQEGIGRVDDGTVGPADRDWVIVRLGAPGVIHGAVIDTAHFLGNYPQACSIEAYAADGYPSAAELLAATWEEIVPRSVLLGGTEHRFAVTDEHRWTHVRLSIFPDGGVARLRIHGAPLPDPRLLDGRPLDLAAVELGGVVLDCSDHFYSAPANLVMPHSPATTADGWETRRRRGAGNDWAVLRLAARGVVRQVVVDTTLFKGNAPGECRVTGCDVATGDVDKQADWVDVLPRTALQPDTVHRFAATPSGPLTHARIDIYPDGGLARLRLYGDLDPRGRQALGLAWLNALPAEQAQQVLLACNAAPAWAGALTAGRPYADRPALLVAAQRAAERLDRDEWLAAFAAHPRIGARGGLTVSSRQEQAGTDDAAPAVLAALAEANREYEERFGHVFLICASGLPAEQMLASLRERLSHDADTELGIAIAEHRKITALRLSSLLGDRA